MAQPKKLSLVEAMIYCLTTEDRGLTVPQIAYLINRNRLHVHFLFISHIIFSATKTINDWEKRDIL